jgi:hypothetical protein
MCSGAGLLRCSSALFKQYQHFLVVREELPMKDPSRYTMVLKMVGSTSHLPVHAMLVKDQALKFVTPAQRALKHLPTAELHSLVCSRK